MRGVIAKFFVNQLRGFRVLTPEILLYLYIGLAGRSYNSVSTAMLYTAILNGKISFRNFGK